MGLAPKFKQWVDNINTINGIRSSTIMNEMIVYITSKHIAKATWVSRELIKDSTTNKVDFIITNIKTNSMIIKESEDKVNRVPLDDKHLEYLNAKLKHIIGLRPLQYWEDLQEQISKVSKDIRTKEAIDRFF